MNKIKVLSGNNSDNPRSKDVKIGTFYKRYDTGEVFMVTNNKKKNTKHLVSLLMGDTFTADVSKMTTYEIEREFRIQYLGTCSIELKTE